MLLSQLHPNEGQIQDVPSNPRTITEEDFAKLKKSLKSFRKMLEARPIVVDENFDILGGNMRYMALCRLAQEGVKNGAFTFTDDIPDNWVKQVTTWSAKEKREFVIKDNQERGQNDWDKIANEWDTNELKDWDVEAANWGSDQDEEEEKYEPLVDDVIGTEKGYSITYEIAFNNEQEQDEWYKFLYAIKRAFPEKDTISERILLVTEQWMANNKEE